MATNKYWDSVVYVIKTTNNDTNKVSLYVGSTTEYNKRVSDHNYSIYNETGGEYHKKLYTVIRENDFDWNVSIHKNIKCEGKRELELEEERVRVELNADLNMRSCYRSEEESIELRKLKSKVYYQKNTECLKEKRRKKRIDNPEKYKEDKKTYRKNNIEKVKKQERAYYTANKEKYKEYRVNNEDKIKEYRTENRDNIAKNRKEYRAENKQKLAENNKVWRIANKKKQANYRREYNIINREKIRENRRNDIIRCECGSVLQKTAFKTHENTIKHKKYIASCEGGK